VKNNSNNNNSNQPLSAVIDLEAGKDLSN